MQNQTLVYYYIFFCHKCHNNANSKNPRLFLLPCCVYLINKLNSYKTGTGLEFFAVFQKEIVQTKCPPPFLFYGGHSHETT